MIIRVVYQNNKHDYVPDFMLDELIISGRIKRFYRYSEGRWVKVEVDPVRKKKSNYNGHERRRSATQHKKTQ